MGRAVYESSSDDIQRRSEAALNEDGDAAPASEVRIPYSKPVSICASKVLVRDLWCRDKHVIYNTKLSAYETLHCRLTQYLSKGT